MNTEIQTLKAENQNLKLLLQDKKKEDKGQVSQIQFYIEALTSKFILIEENLAAKPQKIEEEFQLQIKKNESEKDKMEIEKKFKHNKKFTPSLQQNVVIVVKSLDIYGDNVCSEKKCLKSTEKNLEHQRDCIVTVFEIFIEEADISRLKCAITQRGSWFLVVKNRQLQKDNNDLRIYLNQLEKNYKKMQEQFQQPLQEKEELSQFKIDSDDDMYS